jgi:hypothetical protein
MSQRTRRSARRRPPGAGPDDAGGATRFLQRHVWLTAALLALLVVIVYAPVRTFQFVNWDDPAYITDNPHIRAGLTWQSAAWALTTGYTPYWHPLTWMSHLADVSLFGFDPGPPHVINLVLHAATTLLLFAVLRRMTGAPGRSAFVAAVFATHPLHVESVAWIAERKDVLSGLLWMLTLWGYAAYARRNDWRSYTATLAAFALTLMAKPMVVTLPLVLLLLDVWPPSLVGRWASPRSYSSWPRSRRYASAAARRTCSSGGSGTSRRWRP